MSAIVKMLHLQGAWEDRAGCEQRKQFTFTASTLAAVWGVDCRGEE